MLTPDLYHLSLSEDIEKIARNSAKIYLRYIYKKVHERKFNYLGFITGKHRVGKSTTALALSYVLDPTF